MKKKNDMDEVTLESWEAERKQMEEELAHESAEFRDLMDEARRDKSIDPEIRKTFLEYGEKMMEADDWLRGLYASTSEIVAHCDEMEAKLKALDAKAKKGAAKKGVRK